MFTHETYILITIWAMLFEYMKAWINGFVICQFKIWTHACPLKCGVRSKQHKLVRVGSICIVISPIWM